MVTLYDVDYKYNRNSSKENEELETGRQTSGGGGGQKCALKDWLSLIKKEQRFLVNTLE